MTQNTEEWMTKVDGYVDTVVLAFKDWEIASQTLVNDTVGKDLDTLAEKTSALT
jgi:hypothetical protein